MSWPDTELTPSMWIRRAWSCWRPCFFICNNHGRFGGLFVNKPLSTWRSGWQHWRLFKLRWLRWVPVPQ